jgi:hypothetical protein
MYISKFNKFFQQLNETVELPILDIVIDDNGIIYNGQEAPLVKGRIERVSRGVVTKILGTNNTLYPAGIDKNGNVVAIETDDEGRALNSKGLPIEIPSFIQARYKVKIPYYYASPEYDYYNLIPIEPTGWVNVKIDMEIVKRVKRYAKSLGTNTKSHQSFIDKLLEFEKFSTQKREEKYISRLKRGTIQKEMSCILLLHYINEIKDFFNPSQSGFLFESFIAGLIPDSRIKEDNSPVDIKTSHDRYQLKLVDWKTKYIEVTMDNDMARSKYLEHYMVALKYIDRIELLIIDGVELEKRASDNKLNGIVTAGGRFIVDSLLALKDDSLLKRFKIDLTDIDGRIQNLGESLKMSLNNLYEELSKFQYNVETIITGVNEKGGVVKEQSEFDIYHLKAEDNIKKLAEHLKNLVADINR